ncbi:hypothetical protein PoB_005615200 [Plakobranchus ocellatus]|uniref:Uncharacterized protein n=1 Tax=Plakobranchus ocellatus TaxID=259542 RepID=A0AAV4CE94_9GAST|nr:hypothetical protein PoB_005615200 [Plakobranchus ocellatus]
MGARDNVPRPHREGVGALGNVPRPHREEVGARGNVPRPHCEEVGAHDGQEFEISHVIEKRSRAPVEEKCGKRDPSSNLELRQGQCAYTEEKRESVQCIL